MRSCTMRAAASADIWPGAGAALDDVGEVDEVGEVGDVDVDVDVDSGVVTEVDVVEVGVDVDVAVGDGWSFDVRASAVPVVTASAPATTAPTRSFLVMPFLPLLVRYQQRCRRAAYGRASRRLTRA
jgi:hypothetical protein